VLEHVRTVVAIELVCATRGVLLRRAAGGRPGRGTAAALDVLMAKDGLDPLMIRAIAAATKRSRDLAG